VATDRQHRRTARTIRNLTNAHVHLRLRTDQNDKPYRIELKPRGFRGDWYTVPASLTGTGEFLSDEGRLFEVIPLSEAQSIEYAMTGDYREPVKLVREEETVVSRADNIDEQIQDNPRGRSPVSNARVSGASPRVARVPGSDQQMGSAAGDPGEGALPEGAFPQKVTTERVKGD